MAIEMAGTITALVVQKRNKERVNVYLDGEFAFGLAMIEALKLHKGQHLGDDEIARLQVLDEIEVAHERALNFLSYRPRSAEEVRRRLREKKISETAIETVVGRLERAGLLDDRAFTRFWIENREQFKPRGARALRYELRQKGVPDAIIEDALSDFDEQDAAYRAARAQVRRYAQADQQTFRKRLGDHLTRRGFAYSTVRDVLDRLWAERVDETCTPAHDDLD
jgi:regulatory protein